MGRLNALGAMIAVATMAGAGIAQTPSSATFALPSNAPQPKFDENDPAYAKLYALADQATTLDRAANVDQAQLKAALLAVVELGLATKVRGTDLPHPSAGQALERLAINEQMAGNFAAGEDYARRGMIVLAPFRNYYANSYIQGASLIGYFRGATGKPSDAEAILADAVAFAEARLTSKDKPGPTDYMSASNIQYAYSGILAKLGKLDRAVEMQRHSLASRISAFGADNADAIASRYALAMMLLRAGKNDEAEGEARDAVDRTITHVAPTRVQYPRALEALALVLSRNGKRVEAVEYLRRSLDIKRQNGGPNTLNYAGGLQNLGNVLMQLERYPEARTVLGDAIATYALFESNPGAEALRATGYRGLADFAEGRLDSAEEQLESYYRKSIARDASDREAGQLVLPSLVLTKLDRGDLTAARVLAAAYRTETKGLAGAAILANATADALIAYVAIGVDPAWAKSAGPAAKRIIETVADNRALSAGGELPQAERAALDLVLRIAAAAGDPALALDAMTILAGSRIAQANHLLTERLANADPVVANRVRAFQDITRAYQAADKAWLASVASTGNVSATRAERDAAAARLAAARTALSRDYPRWTDAAGLDRVGLAAVQRGLAADEAILGVIPAFDGVYVLAINRQTASVERTVLGRAAIVAKVQSLRQVMPSGAFDIDSAYHLYRQIFTDRVRATLKDAKSLRIVASGPVAALPFAALLQDMVTRADRSAPFLIKRYALVSTATFATVPPSAPIGRVASATSLFAVGAPAPFPDGKESKAVMPAENYFMGGDVIRTANLSSLPKLPGIAHEIAAISARLSPSKKTVLTGADASEARVRTMDLSPYSVIMFATHGLMSGEMEGVAEPALVLAPPTPDSRTDGLLAASEIAELKLTADWVILSACNTAAGDGAAAPAYSGMAQAFRYAGARSLLLSHWPVRNDAAAKITIATVRNAERGMRREIALQRAMLGLIADRTIPDSADPYVWAPYVLLN